jgi:hypothetical protein
MANYNPPLENLPIFDNALFLTADIPITQADADKRYLRFPNAQGTENLLNINVAGLASMLSGLDIVDGTNKTNIDQSGANITIDNNVNNGTLIYKANNGSGVETSILSLNSTTGSLTTTGTTTLTSTDLTLTTTNPPTCSAVQPAANDATTKIPTTAWVQSAIAAIPAPIPSGGQPFFYGNWNLTSNPINPYIVWSNGNSWGPYSGVQLKINYSCNWGTNYASIYTYESQVDIYPYRLGYLGTYSTTQSYLANNSVQAVQPPVTPQTNYYQPTTSGFTQRGRQNWSSSVVQSGGNGDGYSFGSPITALKVFTGQSSGYGATFGIYVYPPASGLTNQYFSLTILNQGAFPTGSFCSVGGLTSATTPFPATAYGGSGFVSIT